MRGQPDLGYTCGVPCCRKSAPESATNGSGRGAARAHAAAGAPGRGPTPRGRAAIHAKTSLSRQREQREEMRRGAGNSLRCTRRYNALLRKPVSRSTSSNARSRSVLGASVVVIAAKLHRYLNGGQRMGAARRRIGNSYAAFWGLSVRRCPRLFNVSVERRTAKVAFMVSSTFSNSAALNRIVPSQQRIARNRSVSRPDPASD